MLSFITPIFVIIFAFSASSAHGFFDDLSKEEAIGLGIGAAKEILEEVGDHIQEEAEKEQRRKHAEEVKKEQEKKERAEAIKKRAADLKEKKQKEAREAELKRMQEEKKKRIARRGITLPEEVLNYTLYGKVSGTDFTDIISSDDDECIVKSIGHISLFVDSVFLNNAFEYVSRKYKEGQDELNLRKLVGELSFGIERRRGLAGFGSRNPSPEDFDFTFVIRDQDGFKLYAGTSDIDQVRLRTGWHKLTRLCPGRKVSF